MEPTSHDTAWQELGRATLPGGDVLTLRRRGGAFEIRFNLTELMSNRNPVSERAMARLACTRIDRNAAHVLIGGLGMGCTLRAVLDELGPAARVTVAELVPEVIAWNRGPLAGVAARPLDDARVTVLNTDVAKAIGDGSFDAILMDVDNGPEAVFVPSNRELYSVAGIGRALCALNLGGVLALWSADPSRLFEAILETGGFPFERVDVPFRTDGLSHTVYIVAKT